MVLFLGVSKESEDDEVMQQRKKARMFSNIENKQRKELKEPKLKDK